MPLRMRFTSDPVSIKTRTRRVSEVEKWKVTSIVNLRSRTRLRSGSNSHGSVRANNGGMGGSMVGFAALRRVDWLGLWPKEIIHTWASRAGPGVGRLSFSGPAPEGP